MADKRRPPRRRPTGRAVAGNGVQLPAVQDVEDAPWATPEMLGAVDKPWEETVLPLLGAKVRVRYLGTGEIASLNYLPDLVGYTELLRRNVQSGVKDSGAEPLTLGEQRKLMAESVRYKAHVCHLAVVRFDPEDPWSTLPEPEVCAECDPSGEVKHPPSMVDVAACGRWQPMDMDHVMSITLRAQTLGFLRPFSKDAHKQNALPLPADSGG